MRDFFISYRSLDKAWAEWVAWQLAQAGYLVYIQAWDFSTGNSVVERIQTGLSDCKHTVAILSPNYFTSDYTQAEWQAALKRDITGKERRLIPIRVKECDIPELLDPLAYIDLVGKSKEQALNTLLEEIQPRQRPETEPEFPGESEPPFPREHVPQQTPTDITSHALPHGATHLNRPSAKELRGVTHLNYPSTEDIREVLKQQTSVLVMIGGTIVALEDYLAPALREELCDGDIVLNLDFATFDPETFQDRKTLCRAVIANLRRQMRTNLSLNYIWLEDAGDTNNIDNFVQNHVVPKTDSQVYLIITHINPLLNSDFKDEFFAMWRGWHTARSSTPRVNWKGLTLILITRTAPDKFITDQNISPFNVGTWVHL